MEKTQMKIKGIVYQKSILQTINTYDDEKIDEYSEFLIGSNTKVFTIIILLILQDKKLLNINDFLDKYIPSNKRNDFSKITIKNVIEHKASLKRDSRNPTKQYPVLKDKTASAISKTFLNKNLFIKGKNINKKEFFYSNIGYILLGRVIEAITQKTYIEIYKKYIFNVLKMNNTDIGTSANITIYDCNDKKINKKVKDAECYYASSAYGLHSCVHDLILFGKNIPKLLSKKTLSILTKLYICPPIKHIISHGGSITGMESFINYKYSDSWKFIGIDIKWGWHNALWYLVNNEHISSVL